jgi:hypothetical protein
VLPAESWLETEGPEKRGRRLRRPFLQAATSNATVRPTKAKNPANTDATNIFSNVAMVPSPDAIGYMELRITVAHG